MGAAVFFNLWPQKSSCACAVARLLAAVFPQNCRRTAGIAAMMGGKAASEAVQVLGEQGLDLSGHETQPLTEPLVRHADVVAADYDVRAHLMLYARLLGVLQ